MLDKLRDQGNQRNNKDLVVQQIKCVVYEKNIDIAVL